MTYKAKDRVIVNVNTIRKPEYYTATVTSVRRNGIYLTYDDGVQDICVAGDKVGVIGRCAKPLKRKTEIPKEKLSEWLAIKEIQPTTRKPKTSNKPVNTIVESLQDEKPENRERPPKLVKQDWVRGDIVAVKRNNKWLTGVVTQHSGDTLTFKPTFAGVPVMKLEYNGLSGEDANVVKVLHFLSKPCDFEDLTLRNVPLLELFNTRKAFQTKDKSHMLHIITSMWHYINGTVFDNKLKAIPLIKIDAADHLATAAKTGSVAYFSYVRNTTDPSRCTLSFLTSHVRSMNSLLQILAHEIIHQHQYEDLGSRVFATMNADEAHGTTFMKWAPLMRSILGVRITQSVNAELLESIREAKLNN